VLVDCGHKDSGVQTADEFALELGGVGGLLVGPGIHDLAGLADGATEIKGGIFLPVANQTSFIDAVDNRGRASPEKGGAKLR
jgi:hypothetical protein